MILKLILYSFLVRISFGIICIPNAKTPASKLAEACRILPYRSFYVAGRCFFGVTGGYGSGENVCQNAVKFNPHFASKPGLAILNNRAIRQVLIQSATFDPKVRYVISDESSGAKRFMSGSKEGVLCESFEVKVCPRGFIRNANKCYKMNTNPETMQQAIDNCASLFADSTLAYPLDDEENRFLAAYGSEKSTESKDGFWIGVHYSGQHWYSSDDPINEKSVSYYRFFFDKRGMYTQSSMKPASTNPATLLINKIKYDTKGSYGYWQNLPLESNQHKNPYMCQINPSVDFASQPEREIVRPLEPIERIADSKETRTTRAPPTDRNEEEAAPTKRWLGCSDTSELARKTNDLAKKLANKKNELKKALKISKCIPTAENLMEWNERCERSRKNFARKKCS